MNPPLFSLKVDFFTPKVFRNSAAAELARRLFSQDGLKHPRRLNRFLRSNSLAAQAALVPRLFSAPTLSAVEGLAKIDIRSKSVVFILLGKIK